MFVPADRANVIAMRKDLEIGDIKMVHAMTVARKMGARHVGYSYDYVKRVLNGRRSNSRISALHDEVVALRSNPDHCS